jgi:transposase
MSRNHYDKEFKENAIQLVLKSKESVSKISEDLGINESTLGNWVTRYRKQAGKSDEQLQQEKEESEELRRLRRENALLKQERDILKKAAAYFAKEAV